MIPIDELVNYILSGKQSAIVQEFESWVRGSRRFKAFAIQHRDKIRTKFKNVRDPGGLEDLRAELETAVLLLREERFTLEYEKYAALKQRGPDFTVTFKTHTPFNVEVRRIHSAEWDADGAARTGKLMTVLCEKAGQMPPSIVNLLWLMGERAIALADLTHAVVTLRGLADRQDQEFFKRRGLESAAAFVKQFQRLSGIVLRESGKHLLWVNPSARHRVPPEIAAAIQRIETL